ncbi:MAG: spoVD, partial [Symbiobacteriaceae bacterium]|nr:spoVD [Symbiobacteriaceae bacterium]
MTPNPISQTPITYSIARRLFALTLIVLLLLAALGGRLYHLQVAKNAAYTAIAHSQRTLSLPLSPERGLILDRNGEPLSDPVHTWRIGVFPPFLDDRATEAAALARLLGDSAASIEYELWEMKKQGWLPYRLDEQTAAAVRDAGLAGIAAAPVLHRVGENPLARHLLGYVNANGGAQGLEYIYDAELKGGDVPALTAYVDGHGNPLAGLGIRAVVPTAGKAPYQLITTIDKRFQAAVEEVLDRAAAGRPVAAVVMDPENGEVLAMASRPTFDPNKIENPNNPALHNRAVRAEPPGSVFKAVIAAAALEAGLVEPDEEFYCDGEHEIDGWHVTDAGHGWLTFSEAVAKSCNIVFGEVGAERLGVTAMREVAAHFGFGEATDAPGRPWPEESAGTIVRADDPTNDIQMAIGQGDLEVTPLQLARAYSAIANGGTLPAAKLVKAVKSPAGEVVVRPAAGRPERVISRETAARLKQMLEGVTDPGGAGTGKLAWVPGAGSAGKTGSAEDGRNESGGAVVHAWF